MFCEGFSTNDADKYVCSRFEKWWMCHYMFICVEYMLIFATWKDIVFKTKLFLGSKFEMRDMGETSVILGVKVIRKGYSILISQEQYIEKLLIEVAR